MKRDLSKPLAPTFGSSPKRTKTRTRNADGGLTVKKTRTRKDGSLAKSVTRTVGSYTPSFTNSPVGKKVTRNVEKHSKDGNKVTTKNRTTKYGAPSVLPTALGRAMYPRSKGTTVVKTVKRKHKR